MFFQNLKPLILEEKKKQLQKQNVKMNLTVKCEERRAENGLKLRFGQNDDCAMKTSTCYDLNITEVLGSSSKHDNLGIPSRKLSQDVRVKRIRSVLLILILFLTEMLTMMTRKCRTLPLCVYTWTLSLGHT